MISKPQPKNYSPINTASRAAFFNRIGPQQTFGPDAANGSSEPK